MLILKNFLLIYLVGILFSGKPLFGESNTKIALRTLIKICENYGAATIYPRKKLIDREIPILKFGRKLINKKYDIVDFVKKEHGGTATVFVKDGDEFVRISTNVLKSDGTRAIGTNLAHNQAYEKIKKGETFCGEIDILGNLYDTCYQPIKNNSKEIIGIFYVGFQIRN